MTNDVYIFMARADWNLAATQAQLLTLPHAEQLHSQRYTHPLRLRSFVASRLLLRQALTDINGRLTPQQWVFAYKNQRLQLNPQQSDWHTSLSHSGEWVACVLAKTVYCGIDIECRNTDVNQRFMAIAQRFFHPVEYQQLVTLPDALRFDLFIDFWTRKEACVKAWHRGLAHHLASISFQQNVLNPVSFPREFVDYPLTVSTRREADWQLACAVNSDKPEWIFREWYL